MLSLILLILAGLLFLIAAAANYVSPNDWPHRTRVVCLGLACWVAAELAWHGAAMLAGGK